MRLSMWPTSKNIGRASSSHVIQESISPIKLYPTMNITEKIKQIKHLREQKNIAIKAEYNNTRPMKEDLGEIASIFDKFKSVCNPKCKDNTKIFVLLVFFMYSPVSFLNKRICRGGVRREIAKVLGLSNSAVTIYFGDAKYLLLNHKGFREEAQRIFEQLS